MYRFANYQAERPEGETSGGVGGGEGFLLSERQRGDELGEETGDSCMSWAERKEWARTSIQTEDKQRNFGNEISLDSKNGLESQENEVLHHFGMANDPIPPIYVLAHHFFHRLFRPTK